MNEIIASITEHQASLEHAVQMMRQLIEETEDLVASCSKQRI